MTESVVDYIKRTKRLVWFIVARLWTLMRSRICGIEVGSRTIIRPGVKILKKGGSIKIGSDCEIHSGAAILAYGGPVEIGNSVSVNPYTIIYGQGGVSIGDGTRIAAHCVIIPSNHAFDPRMPIYLQALNKIGIRIGSDVWIAAGAKVLDGADIANGCVVAAGSVVTRKLVTEPFGIYAGVPAKKIGSRLDILNSTDAMEST